jgi:hypothetical protein
MTVFDKDRMLLTGFSLGTNTIEFAKLMICRRYARGTALAALQRPFAFYCTHLLVTIDQSRLILVASFEAFKQYRGTFKAAFPHMSKKELNSMFSNRAQNQIFSLIDQNDELSHYGCLMAGNLCAINGAQSLFGDARAPRNHGDDFVSRLKAHFGPHLDFVTITTALLFKPHQVETVCVPGLVYSLQSAAKGGRFQASCQNTKFFD